ncbi:MAG: peptidoglycan DD-metalloendopeptidase family protein [Gallionella sp.]|nr:peptidoglycan DD-metalloendopeptidase family protein [Gallionella sp.]
MKLILAWLAVASLLAGCASSGQRAPVEERSSVQGKKVERVSIKPPLAEVQPRVHVVQKGDTLYGIAFNYGLDPHELAERNAIQDPNLIQIGQQISLFSAAPRPAVVASLPVSSQIKDQPRVVKYPYNESAVAKAEAVQAGAESAARPVRIDTPARVETPAEIRSPAKPDSKSTTDGEDVLEWSMPTQGKLIASFSESESRKGIDISGKLGQPVFASAPGKVVYSGSGLRGYGKLLIVKHNKTYLSAYAHNDHLLVKEGDAVTRGQKIAEMGHSDSDQVKLHFEVRRLGKPVDPANYLALGKP